MEWIMGDRVELPPESDMDFELIDDHQVTLSNKIIKVFMTYWNSVSRVKSKYFVQLEKTEDYTHLHFLVETRGVKSFVLGRHLNKIKELLIQRVYGGVEPQLPNWMEITKIRNRQQGGNGANKVHSEDYIDAYLLPKVQSELQWAWTNIEKYILACLNLAERKRLVKAYREQQDATEDTEADEEGAVAVGDTPLIRNKAARRYMALVSWLVENGITTEKQWIQENSESYLSFNSTGNARASIKNALDNACKVMLLTKSAPDYLVGKDPCEDIKSNRIYRIFKMNGYDPAYAGSVLLGWCKKEFGKRNTIWLFGPATTGKTNIAEAIAHTVPFYGCVNWNNENFPFNDCVDKMLIWWEEGKMTTKVVEQAKAILGGSKVRVDIKCKTSQPMEPTPVIITSNTNMTVVIDGNSTTFEHEQPLQDRMFKFELTKRLGHDFGKITKQEVKGFFKWVELNKREVRHEFMVCKGGGKEAGEYKIPAKRARLSDASETPTETELSVDYSSRYVSKCTRHFGMTVMKYFCAVCERMNRQSNVCTPHGKPFCPECFPAESVCTANFTARYAQRCESHSYAQEVPCLCPECEYLNRATAACFTHGMTKCPTCHEVPPWMVQNGGQEKAREEVEEEEMENQEQGEETRDEEMVDLGELFGKIQNDMDDCINEQ